MTEEKSCCGSAGSSTLIFACAGSSNVGQITYGTALRLAGDGAGKMSCLAGVGAHLSLKVKEQQTRFYIVRC